MRHRLEKWSFRKLLPGRRAKVSDKSNKYSTDTDPFSPSLLPFRETGNVYKTMLKVEMVSSQYLLTERLKVTDEIMNTIA